MSIWEVLIGICLLAGLAITLALLVMLLWKPGEW